MIEFDASKVVIEVDGREVIGFGGTIPTPPTDTDMLDWMIEKSAAVIGWDEIGFSVKYVKGYKRASTFLKTPRAAIAAEMAKEAK